MAPLGIDEILQELPLSFRAHCRGEFEKLLNKAQKYFAAQKAANDFRVLKSHGQLPVAINSLKVPTLQVSSEYKNSGQCPKLESIATTIQNTRIQTLDCFITAKEEEKSYFWKTYLAQGVIEDLCENIAVQGATDLMSICEKSSPDDLPPNLKEEVRLFRENGSTIAIKVLEIARTRSIETAQRQALKREKKLAADVEMSGVSGQTNEKSLEKAVQSVLERREQSRRDKKQKGKTSEKTRVQKGKASNAKSSKKQL